MLPRGEPVPDAQGLAELDAKLRGPLMSYFLRRVGNRTEAEDLTQETFVRLIRSDAFARDNWGTGFVFRIAVNLLHDRRRTAKVHRIAPFAAFDPKLIDRIAAEIAEDREPERVLMGRETLHEVMKVLDRLGDRTRDVFILYRLEGMKQKDIAASLGMGLSTVEKHVMTAMTTLTARFGRLP